MSQKILTRKVKARMRASYTVYDQVRVYVMRAVIYEARASSSVREGQLRANGNARANASKTRVKREGQREGQREGHTRDPRC